MKKAGYRVIVRGYRASRLLIKKGFSPMKNGISIGEFPEKSIILLGKKAFFPMKTGLSTSNSPL